MSCIGTKAKKLTLVASDGVIYRPATVAEFEIDHHFIYLLVRIYVSTNTSTIGDYPQRSSDVKIA